ncbi:hypothetical protein [Paracidovorax wautersii]|uniref:Nicotinamide riboside transporter PnuC n=1 Tax=Paracidovorax wautersii TaxID=1177982 RepID=A0A1I2HY91_9BURK|nr:hypothetical protein [Paracidovorax wautersii]SFF33747.1 hypothetical protein SAMN04489711_1373 [Paracidovorax wautersii]
MLASFVGWLTEQVSALCGASIALATDWVVWQLNQPFTLARLAEVAAAGLSCFGAYVIARHGNTLRSRLGWIAWLASNSLWIGFAVYNGFWAMALMQSYFLWTSFTGLKKTKEPAV